MNSVPPCGTYFLSDEVEHADQERRVEDAGHAAEATDRDHDQEEHEVLEGVLRIEAEELGAESAAERGHAAAEGEGDGEQAAMLMPSDWPSAGCRRRRGSAPHAGALEGEPQADDDHDADRDEQDAVGAVLA